MNFDIMTIVGSLAAVCSTVSFVPQAWKVIRSGKTEDLSAKTYGLTVTGFALWLTYGILQIDWPLIVTNGLSGLLSGFIFAMILLPDHKLFQGKAKSK